jgi:hypothetical protein
MLRFDQWGAQEWNEEKGEYDSVPVTPEKILSAFGPEEQSWRGEVAPQQDMGIQPEDMDLVMAYYSYEDYQGSAMVVYRDKRDGKVYANYGSHCSCYGLEDQWSPEEVSLKELLSRPSYIYVWSWGMDWEEGQDPLNNEIRKALRDEFLPELDQDDAFEVLHGVSMEQAAHEAGVEVVDAKQ